MKNWQFTLIVFLAFPLIGYIEYKKQAVCFDVIPINNMPPGSPVLINKCTGQTWIADHQARNFDNGATKSWVWIYMDKEYVGQSLGKP